eukprot:Gregarina_sp_Poly_1__2879@NODE_1802_length_3302_cov_232_240495_g1171_i0_p1_GENE_NODE_1802_length_3302_cov_232_240495_g1171_i0NODE_1802_length_3302_cov_232_240495_g1171_i0_p1_ORF_typecomplete_len392_score64_192OGFeII_Oxy_3/PF13640_6/0_37_NODE_1802_length_3302_cov_232_240495_g1171_i020933268
MATVEWPDAAKDLFWQACRSAFDLRTSKILEQKIRKGTGTESFVEINSCQCSSQSDADCCGRSVRDVSLAPYCFKKMNNDSIGDQLRMLTSKPIFIRDYMSEVAERASKLFCTVMTDSESQGMQKKHKAELQKMCLTTAISRIIEDAVLLERTRSRRFAARDGGQIAFPSSYRALFRDSPCVKLNSVESEFMGQIMNFGVAEIVSWLPSSPSENIANSLREDYEWIEMNNAMEDQTPFSPTPNRNDFAIWLNLGDFAPRIKLPGVAYLLKKLTSLPFEFNEKAALNLVLSNDALFGLFPPGSYWKKHQDNTSIKELDNGRKFTILYFASPTAKFDDDECDIEVSVHIKGTLFTKRPLNNSVWIFQTRDTDVEIRPAKRKTYIVHYWVYGML